MANGGENVNRGECEERASHPEKVDLQLSKPAHCVMRPLSMNVKRERERTCDLAVEASPVEWRQTTLSSRMEEEEKNLAIHPQHGNWAKLRKAFTHSSPVTNWRHERHRLTHWYTSPFFLELAQLFKHVLRHLKRAPVNQ